jgi:hypothetical protein
VQASQLALRRLHDKHEDRILHGSAFRLATRQDRCMKSCHQWLCSHFFVEPRRLPSSPFRTRKANTGRRRRRIPRRSGMSTFPSGYSGALAAAAPFHTALPLGPGQVSISRPPPPKTISSWLPDGATERPPSRGQQYSKLLACRPARILRESRRWRLLSDDFWTAYPDRRHGQNGRRWRSSSL